MRRPLLRALLTVVAPLGLFAAGCERSAPVPLSGPPAPVPALATASPAGEAPPVIAAPSTPTELAGGAAAPDTASVAAADVVAEGAVPTDDASAGLVAPAPSEAAAEGTGPAPAETVAGGAPQAMPAFPTLGLAACDRYIRAAEGCLGRAPESHRAAQRAAFEKLVGSWQRQLKSQGSAVEPDLELGCKAAFEQARESFGTLCPDYVWR